MPTTGRDSSKAPAGIPVTGDLIRQERLENLYRPRLESVASSLVVGLLLSVALLRVCPPYQVGAWLVGLCVVQFGRGHLFRPSRFKPVAKTDASRWAQGYVLDVVFAGLYWSCSLVWLAPADDLLTHTFMAWALGGLAVGSITVHAYHPPVMYAFLVCLLLPFASVQLSIGEFSHTFLGAGLLLLGLYLATFGRYHGRTLERSIALRHENRQLIAQLETERESAMALKTIAESASLAKSRFFAAASHDLRQPLQALSLYASVLADSSLPASAHQTTLRVRESVNVLEDLFEGMLDIARSEADNSLMPREPVELQQLMNNALLIFGGEALDKGLSLKAVTCSQWVVGDRLALQRIVSNLVANAVRYTQSGRVLIGVRRKRNSARLLVLDTGPGMASADESQIFEEFYRLPDSVGHGFGLGLATVKRLCDSAGYPLGFQSTVGRGSTFWVELPLATSPA